MKNTTAPNRIRAYRKRKNWTQKRLADAINVAPQLISGFETGKLPIRLDYCISMCLALDATLDEMFWIEKRS